MKGGWKRLLVLAYVCGLASSFAPPKPYVYTLKECYGDWMKVEESVEPGDEDDKSVSKEQLKKACSTGIIWKVAEIYKKSKSEAEPCEALTEDMDDVFGAFDGGEKDDDMIHAEGFCFVIGSVAYSNGFGEDVTVDEAMMELLEKMKGDMPTLARTLRSDTA